MLVLTVSDDGPGMGGNGRTGTGLSIVQALVRDELRGDLAFASVGGLRAVVTFPAAVATTGPGGRADVAP